MNKELENLAKSLVTAGFSAKEVWYMASQRLTEKELNRLWSIPRQNIYEFVTSCFANFDLKPPFLDLGCGKRSYKPEITEKLGEGITYIALDHYLSDDKTTPEKLPNLLADVCHLPFSSSSINTVICTELLEHIEDDNLAMAEISRVTKKGGILILTLPGRHIPKHEKPPYQIDYRRYSHADIDNLLIKHSFEILHFERKTLLDLGINLFITAQKTK